jgi:hypothetical protein
MNSAIFKIMSAAGGNFNAVNYNEKKVKQGVAGLVFFENFGSLQDKEEITKEEFTKYLQAYSSRNNKIKNPVFHATCSCKERELSHEQLKDIALEIMQSLGYKENPVLIYEHHDTKNNHIHIVTSRVGEDGKKIKDNFEGKRANQFLNAILKREPHQEFSRLLNNALSYKFGTQAQFVLLMEMNGYKTKKTDGNLLFYKHGEKQGEISLIDIDKRIKLVENERRNTNQIKAIIHKYKKQYSGKLHSNHDHKFTTEQKKFESDLTDFLKQKFGMDFIFFTGKDKDKPYGYMIIDHHNREVYKGSDVLKLDYLINDSVVKEQKDFVTTNNEISAFQNEKNSSNYEFYKTLSEENKTGYVAGENTSNNEIQLGDLFEDFIRELEKENYESNGRARKKGRKSRGI